jgi:hypothetical protein
MKDRDREGERISGRGREGWREKDRRTERHRREREKEFSAHI